MKLNESLIPKIKTIVWSVSAGIIVSFFFSTNFLAWATSFNPGGSALFISPLVCGLILVVVTWEFEAIYTVFAAMIMTVTATVGVMLTLISPILFGVAGFLDAYYIFVAQNVMITIILILPISLMGSMVGRAFAESTIMSPSYRAERDKLRQETEEWYRMLEERISSKSGGPVIIEHPGTSKHEEILDTTDYESPGPQ